jgi:O-antigen/teichoic acid export membrane protein
VLVGGAAICIGVGLAFVLERIFNLSGTSPTEVRSAFVIVTFTVACSLPVETFMAIVNGRKRLYVLAAAESLAQISTAFAIVVMISRGGGLVQLALIQAVTRLALWTVTIVIARRLLPTLRLSVGSINRAALKEVASYGSRNFVINLASFVVNRLDLVVVGAFVNVTMVTRYAIAQTLVDYASGAVVNITQSFTPHFTHAQSEGASGDIKRFYVRGSRLSGAIAMLLAGGLFAYGGHFIRLWLGDELVSGPWWQRSDVILALLLAGQLPRLMHSITWQLFFGVRDVNFPAVVQLVEATLNLTLSLWWVHTLGPAGVALGSTVPLLITNLFIMPRRVCKLLRMSAREYVASCVLPAATLGLVVGGSGFGLSFLAPPVTWPLFAGEVVISASLGALIGIPLVLTREERMGILAAIMKRVPRLSGQTRSR